MITTPDLIDALAANLTPVRRLRPPCLRAACWLSFAALILGLLAISQGLRPDLVRSLHDPAFLAGLAGALATGILAALAAFLLSLPDRSRLWLLLPAPALALWLSSLGYQCLTNWISVDPDGMHLGETARCFATLVFASVPLALALLVMLRHAAALRPVGVILAGGLAVAALTAAALSLFHELDASVMILLWNLGTALLLIGLARAFGRRMFSWVTPRPLPPGE